MELGEDVLMVLSVLIAALVLVGGNLAGGVGVGSLGGRRVVKVPLVRVRLLRSRAC